MQQFRALQCPSHPNSTISSVQVSEKCPFKSRLACMKCLMENKSMVDYIEINDFLSTELVLTGLKGVNDYNQAHESLIKSKQRYQRLVDDFVQDLLKYIAQFQSNLNIQVDQQQQNLIKIQELRKQYDTALNNLQNTLRTASIVNTCHQSKEWTQLETAIQSYIQLFYKPENQEINCNLLSLHSQIKNRMDLQSVEDFKKSLTMSSDKFIQQLPIQKLYETLDDTTIGTNILNKITDQKKLSLKLIFNGQRDGMNGAAFLKHCENMRPTITICESKSGQVFGGYTPCKWINNNQWQIDESMTSFIFSVTKQQIYPLKNKSNAIYNSNGYGPRFGGGPDLYIAPDFQSGSSNLNHSYDYSQYQIADRSTHLFGGTTPALKSIEIYLIE